MRSAARKFRLEDYFTSPAFALHGLNTHRFLQLYLTREGAVRVRSSTSLEESRQLEQAYSYIDFWIRFENLHQDFLDVLSHVGVEVTGEQERALRDSKAQNVSTKRRSCADFYDRESIELIAERDRFLIEKFGYTPPAI